MFSTGKVSHGSGKNFTIVVFMNKIRYNCLKIKWHLIRSTVSFSSECPNKFHKNCDKQGHFSDRVLNKKFISSMLFLYTKLQIVKSFLA